MITARRLQGRRAAYVFPAPPPPPVVYPDVELHGDDLATAGTTLGTWTARRGPDWHDDVAHGVTAPTVQTLAGTASGKAIAGGDRTGAGALVAADVTVPRTIWTPGADRTLALIWRAHIPGGWGGAILTHDPSDTPTGTQPEWGLAQLGPWAGGSGEFGLSSGAGVGSFVGSGLTPTENQTALLALQVRASDGKARIRWAGTWSAWLVMPGVAGTVGRSWSLPAFWAPAGSGGWARYHAAWASLIDDATLDAIASGFGVT